MPTDISTLIDTYCDSTNYDNVLFLAQITLGFNQLLQLAELCMPDNVQLRDYHKLMMQFDIKNLGHHL